MMTTYKKTKFKMVQQYKQVVNVKQQTDQQVKLQEETLKLFQEGDISVCSLPRNKKYMSTKWNVLPFAFPEEEDKTINEPPLPKSKTINEILTLSLKQQKKDEVFDNSGFVTIVVSRCLDAKKIVHKVECGYRCINDTMLPHMWLVIDGYIIDNTYIQEIQPESLEYLCKNTPSCYKSCDFSHPETRNTNLIPQTATESLQLAKDFMKARLDFYIREPDKALALGLNNEQSFDYYFSMIRHMSIGIDCVRMSDIDPKVRYVCWKCGCYPKSGRTFLSDIVKPEDFKETDTPSKTTWKFPHCSLCTVANYCSAECQNADWLDNHRITCLPRDSASLPPL